MTTLAQYDAARAALAQATRIEEVLPLLDEFELAKLKAKQIKDQELLADASEFQLRAERRLGQIITAAKAAGLFRQGKQKKADKTSDPEVLRPTLAEAGIDHKLSTLAQKRASISERAFDLVVQATREHIAAGRARIVSAPSAHGAGRITNAEDLDYSPTPPWATRALVEHVMPYIGQRIEGEVREPACGEGHIAEVLRETCADVIATDIYDRFGYADHIADYLSDDFDVACDWTVTNPPFEDRVIKFIKRALINSRKGVAMFLQLRYLEGVDRYNDIFKNRPPTVIAPFVERVPLLMGEYDPKASTTTAFMWLVWIKGAAPMAPFWTPPGCRKLCARPDDNVRFTAHPVTKSPRTSDGNSIDHDESTGEIVESESRQNTENAAGFVDVSNVVDIPSTSQTSTGTETSPGVPAVSEPAAAPVLSGAAGSSLPQDVELEIPAFLKREADNSFPVNVASPRETQSVSGEASG